MRFAPLVLISLFVSGCARLLAGHTADIAPPFAVDVVLIRGYLDWYSTGIDDLTTMLRAKGYHAEAFREEQWGDIADVIVANPTRPLTLIGFSYGADDVILMSRRLKERSIPVDLLITIDPVTPAEIPQNVKHTVNFYQPNGFWDIFPWLRGVPVEPVSCKGLFVENINVRTHPALTEPGTSHATIAANQKIHQAICTLVSEQVSR